MNLRDLWRSIDDASKQAFFRTLMWIALIAGTVYTIGQSDFMESFTPLAVRIELPEQIVFPRSNITASLPVSVRLKNNTQETALLEAPSPCNIIRWFIITKNGEFVQAPAEETCSQVILKASLPAGQFSQDEFVIPLDTQRYEAGTRYRLMVRYWGQDGGKDFEIEFE